MASRCRVQGSFVRASSGRSARSTAPPCRRPLQVDEPRLLACAAGTAIRRSEAASAHILDPANKVVGQRATVTASGRRRARQPDGLDLEILLESLQAVLPPQSALLVAAEGHVGMEPRAAVDRQRAGADASGHAELALLVGATDHAAQPVARVVGDADGVVVVLVGDDAEHRAEDLVLGDRRVGIDIGERESARRRSPSRTAAVAAPRARGGRPPPSPSRCIRAPDHAAWRSRPGRRRSPGRVGSP